MRTIEYMILNHGFLSFMIIIVTMVVVSLTMLWLMESGDARRRRKSPPVDPEVNELDEMRRRLRESAGSR